MNSAAGKDSIEIEKFEDSLNDLGMKTRDLEKLNRELISEAFHFAKPLLEGNFAEIWEGTNVINRGGQRLFSAIAQRKTLWECLEKTETIGNFEVIRTRYWDNSAERKNLVAWYVERNGGDEKSVEECYGQVWEVLKEMALYHRRQVARKSFYNHELLEWIETKG